MGVACFLQVPNIEAILTGIPQKRARFADGDVLVLDFANGHEKESQNQEEIDEAKEKRQQEDNPNKDKEGKTS